MVREPMTKAQVKAAIERRGSEKIPLVLHKWWGQGLQEKYGDRLEKMAAKFPEDILTTMYTAPGEDASPLPDQSYRWGYKDDYSQAATHSIGESKVLLPDWSELQQFLDDFPDPQQPQAFDLVEGSLPPADGRYRLGGWWRLYHERFWGIRGMENLMLDYYDHMDNLKRVGRHLLDFYKVIVDRYAGLGFDGIFTSDDLGHQYGPMMSPAVFEELYFPLYKDFIDHVHRRGMHVFLHSCGDNTLLMPYLIEAGLDVFHPIQTGCMDEKAAAAEFGDQISFLAGVDVQHLLPEGNADEVRAGVRGLIDALYKPMGGLLLGAGNGIMPDTPLENIEAMLEEMSLYK